MLGAFRVLASDRYLEKGMGLMALTGHRQPRPAEMIVIAARPSMGKTAFAMNVAEHVALHAGKAVAVFSLEMSSSQLVQRLLCSRAKVNLQKLRNGFLSDRDFPSLSQVRLNRTRMSSACWSAPSTTRRKMKLNRRWPGKRS